MVAASWTVFFAAWNKKWWRGVGHFPRHHYMLIVNYDYALTQMAKTVPFFGYIRLPV